MLIRKDEYRMINIDELKFDEKGLIPAIVVDSISKKVLTLAYMNRESLKISMEKGDRAFYRCQGHCCRRKSSYQKSAVWS